LCATIHTTMSRLYLPSAASSLISAFPFLEQVYHHCTVLDYCAAFCGKSPKSNSRRRMHSKHRSLSRSHFLTCGEPYRKKAYQSISHSFLFHKKSFMSATSILFARMRHNPKPGWASAAKMKIKVSVYLRSTNTAIRFVRSNRL